LKKLLPVPLELICPPVNILPLALMFLLAVMFVENLAVVAVVSKISSYWHSFRY
tara:strand:+ start:675 stop:836 length:162 start_codon:yes stop_codon:yes gene_type:complete